MVELRVEAVVPAAEGERREAAVVEAGEARDRCDVRVSDESCEAA